jgi:hypothetical protein
MKFTKSVRYIVRVREYETIQIEVGAEAGHHDLGLDDDELSRLSEIERVRSAASLKKMVLREVEGMAQEELEQVARWSEFSPNLAQDVLREQRSNRGSEKTDSSTATGRRVRRGGGGGTGTAAASSHRGH